MLLDTFLKETKADITATLNEEPELIPSETIPEQIPLEVQKWLKLDEAAAVFIDMVNSSQIDFATYPNKSATIYEVFTGSLVDTMFSFGADYLDVQGDGVLAVYVGPGACAKAFLAAETFRTICDRNIKPIILKNTDNKITILCRTGINFGKTILKRIGRRGANKEVWAYRTINQTAKLCSIARPDTLVMGDAAYKQLESCREVTHSCGCRRNPNSGAVVYSDEKIHLWNPVSQERLEGCGISAAHELNSFWCEKHGPEFFDKIATTFKVSFPRLEQKDQQ